MCHDLVTASRSRLGTAQALVGEMLLVTVYRQKVVLPLLPPAIPRRICAVHETAFYRDCRRSRVQTEKEPVLGAFDRSVFQKEIKASTRSPSKWQLNT
jgi:hypothetical protein